MTRSHHAPPTKHLIQAIHFAPEGSDDPSTCTCACGWSTESPTPELLDLEYRAHRRAVGAPKRALSDTIRDGAKFDVPIT